MAPSDHLRGAKKTLASRPLTCHLCSPRKTKVFVNQAALQDHLSSSIHTAKGSVSISRFNAVDEHQVSSNEALKKNRFVTSNNSTTSGEMLETDPSTNGDSSDDYEDSSGSVEIITDGMKSSSLGASEPRNALSRGMNG